MPLLGYHHVELNQTLNTLFHVVVLEKQTKKKDFVLNK